MHANMVKQSQLSSECWGVQVLGLCHCTDCEFLDTKDCTGKRIRRTGKNANGFRVPLSGLSDS
jgi:hypothetical protein